HFQNTLLLVDALQQAGKQFELMIYPDGMHGYRGAQWEHSWASDKIFWLNNLKNR
ncbi:MAG: prolyl oligopeptidase family serine peptidase, partial [Rikenellaceae bacterium]|nr:prolyl oligopeptidase family serine peptidase [Rikenellaceae bacterium]